MYPGIHNFSEIGKLNKVLLHRPGKELEALTPATLERLLFDDVPYLKIAQEEHDNFARVLRENGVEVVYYVDEVAKAIADPARQIQLVNDFLNISKIHAKGLRASMTSYLLNMPPKQMVAELIAGIKRSEVATKEATSLMDLVEDDYPFVSDPMPNLYFTRDPGACVGNGINIHRMHTPARKRESLLLKYMYLYNRDFATEENKQWYDLSDSYSIEGGDVLVLSKDIVAVGLSQRTTVSGAETFARNLLQNSGFKKVLAFDIPETRAFMHLDTVFTMVDYDKFTIHPEIEGPLSVYEMLLDEQPFTSRLFGMELGRMAFDGEIYDVENDFHGICFLYGWVGLAMMVAFIGYFLYLIVKCLIKDFRKYFTVEAGAFGSGLCLCLVYAYFTAGVLRRPNASIYMSVLLAAVYYLTHMRSEKPDALPDGEEKRA